MARIDDLKKRETVGAVDIVINSNDVIIEGYRSPRPNKISASTWLQYWETRR